uniref:Uncharacterized protein n=1 Tax=Kalanchoe fedtschenkoi TaxID=63787 RepID=A0A7N1A452_KALFE
MSNGTKQLDINQVIDEFETSTKNATEVQKQFLKKLLEQNSSTEYLQKFGLNGKTDVKSFKACVPIVTHEDLEPYVKRMVDGDTSHVLLGKPVKIFSFSSGTSKGKIKFVPYTDESFEVTAKIWRIAYAYRNREFPTTGGKALQFIYGGKGMESTEGITIRQATANLFLDPRFKEAVEAIQTKPCSPYEVIFGHDFDQSLYCHLICALIYRDEIQLVSSIFVFTIVNAFRRFEQVWEELVDDIRHGVVSSRITAPSLREVISKILKPDPASADLIYDKCKGLDAWRGLIPTLFPNVKYVLGIMTGSMMPYVEKMRIYAGHVPIVSADFGASEGWIGVNANPRLPPELTTFTVVPDIAYFEFLPVGNADGVGDTVGLTEVKVGEEYEVIMSNYFGVYRYRLGDIVRVAGFHNSTPQLQFVCRSNVILSVNTDKTTESDLQNAVDAATKVLSASNAGALVDYTSQADMSTDPGHYVIYWEIAQEEENELRDDVLAECCNALDRGFADMGYVSVRRVNAIGPLELRVVRGGTFGKLLEHFLSMGGAASQFKVARCISPSNTRFLEILSNGVVKSYFSTVYD